MTAVKAYLYSKMVLSLGLFTMDRKWDKSKLYIDRIENYEISRFFKAKIKRTLNPTIINFLKGTNQEFSPELLSKFGYNPENLQIPQNNSADSQILV